MLARILPVHDQHIRQVTVASGHIVDVHVDQYILGVYAHGDDSKNRLHIRAIGDVAYGFPAMIESAYKKLEHELTAFMRTHGVHIIARYCTCGTLRSKQSGYTRINELNDFGCGRCRKPTRLYLEKVMIPREVGDLVERHRAIKKS